MTALGSARAFAGSPLRFWLCLASATSGRDSVQNGGAMGEYEFQHLYLPRDVSRGAATRLLTDHAEYGHWELLRLRRFADGSRRVTLRRRVIRAVRTA
jgi:hypothetical protein